MPITGKNNQSSTLSTDAETRSDFQDAAAFPNRCELFIAKRGMVSHVSDAYSRRAAAVNASNKSSRRSSYNQGLLLCL